MISFADIYGTAAQDNAVDGQEENVPDVGALPAMYWVGLLIVLVLIRVVYELM